MIDAKTQPVQVEQLSELVGDLCELAEYIGLPESNLILKAAFRIAELERANAQAL